MYFNDISTAHANLLGNYINCCEHARDYHACDMKTCHDQGNLLCVQVFFSVDKYSLFGFFVDSDPFFLTILDENLHWPSNWKI